MLKCLCNRITRCETVFRGTFKFDNFYFNYHIEANRVNFSPFSRFELRTPGVSLPRPPLCALGHGDNHRYKLNTSFIIKLTYSSEMTNAAFEFFYAPEIEDQKAYCFRDLCHLWKWPLSWRFVLHKHILLRSECVYSEIVKCSVHYFLF